LKYSHVFLSLGSNIGDREVFLLRAIEELCKSSKVNELNASSIYETEPLYNPDQKYFLNMIIEIETDFEPLKFLHYCKGIELKIGREINVPRNSPRKIDIDIEFFHYKMINTKELTIPHPLLYERRFVLEPLSEIAPNFICPKTGKNTSQLLKECQDISYVSKFEEKIISKESNL